MFDLILDSVDDFHTVEERRLHRIFCGLIKNPKIANPKLELSSETLKLDLLLIRAPQLLQYDEVSSTILPQCLQYIKAYPPLLLSIIPILLTDLMNCFSKN